MLIVHDAHKTDRRRPTLERSRTAYESVLGLIDANIAGSLDIETSAKGLTQRPEHRFVHSGTLDCRFPDTFDNLK
jgi:hypothetical protein